MLSKATLVQPNLQLLDSYLTLLKESLIQTDSQSLAGIDLHNQIAEITQSPEIYLSKQSILFGSSNCKLKLWLALQDNLIGVVSIKKQHSNSDEIEYLIGYRIFPSLQGNGHSTQAFTRIIVNLI